MVLCTSRLVSSPGLKLFRLELVREQKLWKCLIFDGDTLVHSTDWFADPRQVFRAAVDVIYGVEEEVSV